MSKQYCKLLMVTPGNNNKYYEMVYEGGSTFTVKYGRVESTETKKSYPYSQWDKKYNEKLGKGYKDVTHLVSVEVAEKDSKGKDVIVKSGDVAVDKFLALMQEYTNGLVSKTYSVKYDKVSQKQVDEAQKILDEITKIPKTKKKEINDKLVELYMIIPRYMSHVTSYLLPSIDLDKSITQEQDNLDAMASQVKMFKKSPTTTKKVSRTLQDILGITMKETKPTKEMEYLVKQLSGRKIQSIFSVNKESEDERFENWVGKQKNKKTSILLHGTRCTSVIPILETGLKIRPAGNFQFSGKAYGEGNYFSEVCNKSIGYTGYDKDMVLLVYEVHTGNPYKYDGWYRGNSFTLNYKNLSERGYDSTYVKAGSGLLNSEIIAYKEQQSRIKYLIWLKR